MLRVASVTRAHRPVGQDGSVLMLVPAGVLVLILLAALAVDSSVAFMAQRELTSAAAAAANDAAGAAVSDDAFYLGGGTPGQIVLDQGVAEDVASEALERQSPRGISDVRQRVAVRADHVCVVVTGRVDYIFAKAIPGRDRGRRVTGRAVATAAQGDAGTALRVQGDDICPT